MTQTSRDTTTRGQGLPALFEILRRRRTLAILPLVLVLAATVSVALFLPSLWTASATIMVDRQQIPEAFVKSTVTSDVESRLLTLSQEILSRTRLLKIIDQYQLYPDLRRSAPEEEVVERMRRDIRLEFNDGRDRRPKDTKTVAFSVSYTSTRPETAMMVANTLASLYIDENGKLREKQAVGTSDFLETQLVEARRTLARQEQKIVEYKERYIGELPEQRDANLRTLERLQQQLQLVAENLRRAQERRQQITQALAEIDQSAPEVAVPTPANSAAVRLALLRQELFQMQTGYRDTYPDVVQMKEQIRLLEEKVAAEASALPKQTGSQRKPAGRVIPQNGYIQSLMTQLDQATIETKTGAEEIATLNRQIAVYQRRIENAPKRDHELTQLTRDNDTTREMFRSLLAKREEAGIAANLEQQQHGEQFRIMDPAVIPERPAGPNRLRLLLVGLVLAAGASGAAVILAENVDTSYRRVDEVRSRLPVPVLSTIPHIATESDRRRHQRQRRLAAAALAGGLLVIVGCSYAVAHNNHGLVGLLMSDQSATGAKR
jgi:polysaccharide chain length determinant protein (PEP-CTERM system associated)